jgi:hypothetical protein
MFLHQMQGRVGDQEVEPPGPRGTRMNRRRAFADYGT